MVRLSLIFLLMIVFTACFSGRKKITREHPEGFYKEVFYVIDDSIRDGSYMKYFADRQLADSCAYRQGLLQGTRKIFTQDGKLEIVESYDQGRFHGPYSSYYPNGQIKKTMQYIDNKIQGELIEYHMNGEVKAILQMVDNLENGPFREFYEDGTIHWEGFYLEGDFEQDTLKEFNTEGEMIRKLFCEKGICQTVWTRDAGYRNREKIFSE